LKQAEFRCKWIRQEEIWQSAESVRALYWSAGKLPVDVEAIVEFKLKLAIEPEHGLEPQMGMEAYLQADLTGIIVDHDHYMNEKFANRMRFSFAHELGHFFLHREFYEGVTFETAEEWTEILLGIPETDYTNFEYQANEFAGRLLVPQEALVQELQNACDVMRQNRILDHIKSDPYAVLSAISTRIGRTFGVSSDVIERRVEREKLWPPDL